MTLQAFDEPQAAVMKALCEAIVPGSARVRPVVYVDALVAGMPKPGRAAVLDALETLGDAARAGPEALEQHAGTPAFLLVRALAIEAFYSDFVAPGAEGPGAWAEIDFNSPLATRLDKDWPYLGIVS